MVLCPYVFVISKHDIAPLRLQPSEVASAHWVSLRALLSPSQRTVEFVDVANRYSRDLRRWHNHFLLGEMVFAAVRLIPSESSYSTSQSGFIPAESKRVSAASKLRRWWRNDPLPAPSLDVPLHLWGLTLGVMADFLDLLPPHNAIRLWIYPTFTAYDLQFILWVMSYRFKARKEELLLQGIADMGSPITLEDGVQAVPVRNESFAKPQLVDADGPHYDAGIEGLSLGRMARQPKRGSRSDAVGSLLEGYYDYIRRSIQVTMLTRTAVAATLLFYFIKRRRRI